MAGSAVPGQDGVQVGALAGLGISVDQGRRQAGQGVQQVMLGVDGDLVGLDGGGIAGDDDLAFGP